jgi:Flp pilus assembly protein TadG
MVEFAIVFPVALLVILGIIVGSFLFFQSEAVTNGARGGSRWATVESSLYVASGGNFCESGNPDTIVNAVKKSANVVPVNTAQLCTVGGSTTELVQTPNDPSKANIVVDATPSLAAPTCVTITVTYVASPLSVPFLKKVTLRGYSSSPIAASSSSTTTTTTSTSISCPAPH